MKILGSVLAAFILGAILNSIFKHDKTAQITCKTIQEIGTCDRDATCGVIFTDKSTGTASYPIKNIEMCQVSGTMIEVKTYKHSEDAQSTYNKIKAKEK